MVVSISAAPASEVEDDTDEEEYNRFTAFLKCMGPKWAHDCGVRTLKCAVERSPLKCILAIVCGGIDAHKCSHHVH